MAWNCRLNEAIRHFYIDAVLRVEVLESGQVRIENIGGDRSPATQVKLARKLQWDPDRKAMLLRGTMGPQYVLSAYVDNVEIDCFSPEPAESRGSAP